MIKVQSLNSYQDETFIIAKTLIHVDSTETLMIFEEDDKEIWLKEEDPIFKINTSLTFCIKKITKD